MIKRSLAVLLICAPMCLALTGCGDDNSYSGHLQTHSIKNTESSPDSSDTQGEQTTTKGSFKWRIVHTSPTTTTTTVSSTTSQTTTTTEQTGGENTAPPETTTTAYTTVTASPTYTYAPPTQSATAAPTHTLPQTSPSSEITPPTQTEPSEPVSSSQQNTNFSLAQ